MKQGSSLENKRSVTRRVSLHLGMIGLAAFVAGCSVVPKGPAKAPTDTPATPTEVPTDGRHNIALLVPLSGPNAAVGESIANAANMAVIDTGGTRLRLTTYDTATGAAAAAQRAISEGNKLILGPLLADDVREASTVTRQAKVPLIAFSNDVSVAGNGAYLLGFTPAQSVARVVTYARSKGMNKFAALVPSGVYGQRAVTALTNTIENNGGSIVSVQTFERTPASMIQAVAKLNKDGAADAVLIADSSRSAIQAVPLLRKGRNARTTILGTELWNTESGLFSSPVMNGSLFASVSDTLYNQMANKYKTRFGKAPMRLASLGYDAVLLATKVSTNWKPGTAFPLRALDDTGGFAGIDGPFRFNAYGVAERALEVQQVAPSGAVVVLPAPKSFSN
jgi:branched-chain amino acid transport system substrate-binding protein